MRDRWWQAREEALEAREQAAVLRLQDSEAALQVPLWDRHTHVPI